jgi:hypothetical protein
MTYTNTNPRVTTESQIIANGKLIAAKHEADDDALEKAVDTILAAIPSASQAEIQSGNFRNCLDFAHDAVHELSTAGYVSEADYRKFEAVYNAKKKAVKDKTDAGIKALCTGEPDGSCKLPKKGGSTAPSKNSKP